jgi:sporulation protein YlmC with PRC-barrel domain
LSELIDFARREPGTATFSRQFHGNTSPIGTFFADHFTTEDCFMFARSFTAALLGTTLLATAAFAQTPTTTPSTGTSMTPSASASDTSAQGQWRASKLVGLNVYNQANESLGDINDLITDSQGKISQVILGVGGFLGVGERYVAVPYEKLQWVNQPVAGNTAMNSRPVGPATTPSTTSSGATTTPSTTTGSASTSTSTTTTNTTSGSSTANRWYPDHAVYNASKDELKAAPEFKYTN